MKRLAEWLWRACGELGLRPELGFKLSIPGAPEITAVARIPELGAKHGMLVFKSNDEIRAISKQLLDAGYGYSVLDEPLPNEEFDLEVFKDIFAEWGWSGEAANKPAWMKKLDR